MNSKDEHNDPLERFFKEKAEQYDISYREEDWLDLEKKLDLRQAARTRQKRTFFAAAAVLLIVSVMGYFIYENSNEIDRLNRQLEENMTTGIIPDSNSNDSATQEESEPITDLQSQEEISENTDRSPVPSYETTPEPKTEDLAVLETESPQIERVEVPHIELPSAFYTTEAESLTSPSTGGYTPADRDWFASLNHQQARSPKSPVIQNKTDNRTSLTRFEFDLLVSPDISTIGEISNFYEPGFKLGVTGGYQINERFTLSGGIIQSKVKYSSGSQNYNLPQYTNTGSTPSGITAECLILDIPISLKYNVLRYENSRFFATGGLSSYVMLSEDYHFDYESSYPGQITTRNERSGNIHLFSNAGFSVGYEYDLHQNWSLKAEPFIKVPLKEVGWGNVKLYTLGSFVSVSYKL